MDKSIGDILNEEPVAETETPVVSETPTEPEATPEPIVDAPSSVLRDEKGRFAPKETGVEQLAPVAAEPVPPTEQANQLPKEVYEPLRAVRDENRELKQRLQALERQTYYQPPKPQQPQAAEVDFWDNPNGFFQNMQTQMRAGILQELRQLQQEEKLDSSEKTARSKYADYDDAFQAFEQAVHANPRLAVELAQSSDPGEFAYSKGKAALAIQTVGSLDELKAQIRAELEAEARAAIQPAQRPVLPSTTAADTSVGARGSPEWGGPPALKDILRK